MANFNRIAPLYDLLSKMVFGNALSRAKDCFIHTLPEHGTVLFIGGGSGYELKKIISLKPALKIDFVETSGKFISMAKAKLNSEELSHIHFIHGSENQIVPDKKYAAIITFCIVDLFPQKEAEEFCAKIISHLEPGGLWLFVDFIPPQKTTQKLLLKCTYLFFKIIANISSNHAPDYNIIFQQLNMKIEARQLFYGEMICSQLLRKQG
jgi:tRNA (cmo5U34)-methyltransferase